MTYQPLTDLQWEQLQPIFPLPRPKKGKPHTPWRAVLNSILIVLIGKIKWTSIPNTPEYASKSASHRWYLRWKKEGLLDRLLDAVKTLSNLTDEIPLPPRRNRLPKTASMAISQPV